MKIKDLTGGQLFRHEGNVWIAQDSFFYEATRLFDGLRDSSLDPEAEVESMGMWSDYYVSNLQNWVKEAPLLRGEGVNWNP